MTELPNSAESSSHDTVFLVIGMSSPVSVVVMQPSEPKTSWPPVLTRASPTGVIEASGAERSLASSPEKSAVVIVMAPSSS